MNSSTAHAQYGNTVSLTVVLINFQCQTWYLSLSSFVSMHQGIQVLHQTKATGIIRLATECIQEITLYWCLNTLYLMETVVGNLIEMKHWTEWEPLHIILVLVGKKFIHEKKNQCDFLLSNIYIANRPQGIQVIKAAISKYQVIFFCEIGMH